MAVIYVGIDPGKKGAFAILNGRSAQAYYTPMQKTKVRVPGKTKTGKPKFKVQQEYGVVLMMLSMRSIAKKRKEGHTVVLVIERQQYRPSDSKKVVAQTAAGFAVWLTVCKLAGFVPQLISPTAWKPKYLEAGSVKAVSRRACTNLYPALDLSLVKSEALAEALLMADYARRKRENLPFPPITYMTPEERAESQKIRKTKADGVARHEAKTAAKVGKARRRLASTIRATTKVTKRR